MASAVTWDVLKQLASFRAENGCAISVYVDLDPSISPTPADARTRFHSLLDKGHKRAGSTRNDLTHEQRLGLESDFQRIREFFDERFERDGARGYAVFCAGLDNVWQILPLSESVPDEVHVNRQLYLAPLVPLVGRGEGAIVASVGRERGELQRLLARRVGEVRRREVGRRLRKARLDELDLEPPARRAGREHAVLRPGGEGRAPVVRVLFEALLLQRALELLDAERRGVRE